MYQTLSDFKDDLRLMDSGTLLEKWLSNPLPFVFPNKDIARSFFGLILQDWPESQLIQCAGTANWRYSLNPKKNFREFNDNSDIDVIVVSQTLFNVSWENLRTFHRGNWYRLDYETRQKIRRYGENVYSGFVSPKWIVDRSNELRFRFVTALDSYSCADIGYRTVNMLFFKNEAETFDYYRRGIEEAKRRI